MACYAPMISSVCLVSLMDLWHTEEFERSTSFHPSPGSANLVLEDTVERIYAGNTFAEKWCGLFLIRGENVVLLGEIVPSHSPLTYCDDL
jgi:LSM domain